MFSHPDNLMGVPHDENYLVTQWSRGGAKVVFSYCILQKGIKRAYDCHFSANKKALRVLKDAFNDFINLVKISDESCEMLIASTSYAGVEKVIKKCGFEHIANATNCKIYMRLL